MAFFRGALWVLVVVFAGVLAFLTYEFTRNDPAGSNGPYGVPFELVDENGEVITQAAFQGRPTALFFGFTHCPDVCPTTLYELDRWMAEVDPDGDDMAAYMVSVDPERDTPNVLDTYVSNVSDRIHGITGDPQAVADMVKGFNIYARKVPLDENDPEGDYTMDHTASVFLLDEDGQFRSTIAYGENGDTAVQKLKNLIEG
ncbi:SCO family protein [Pararhizobium haloflavum]|uniref:SCO family protein n=1 Tax=Pararhizobium haloflavum TaxID=2037914 RepID=UPI000C193D51|nr:SCO family protein [Pararhizobium haloflavum]